MSIWAKPTKCKKPAVWNIKSFKQRLDNDQVDVLGAIVLSNITKSNTYILKLVKKDYFFKGISDSILLANIRDDKLAYKLIKKRRR
jgi:hypothetical protein